MTVWVGGSFFVNFALATVGVNRQINFQGKVVNKTAGTNVANGNYDFEFKLYNVSSGGSPIWTETRTAGNQVAVTDGIFQVSLGSVTTFASAGVDFTNDSLYLEVSFNGEVMGTRIRLTSTAYSLFSEQTQGLTIPTGETVTFADSFTTVGAFPLTLTTSASTNVTLPTTGTLATLAGTEELTNKTIGSTGLVFSGATTDIDTAAAEGLVLQGRGASSFNTTSGNLSFQVAGTGTIATVQIGAGGSGSSTPDYFALDVKSDTGDPAGGFEGAMYYNTFDNKFRCYQNAGWADCIGGGGSGAFSDITGSTNTTAAMVVGSGATLDYSGSGTINASSLIGGTWASPGAIGGTSANTGAFTSLTASSTITQTFTGTTTTGTTINANSLTTGNGLTISSTSTGLTTGKLMSLDWSPGSSTIATGDLLNVNVGANGILGNIFDVENAGSSVFSVSQSAISANLPLNINGVGDVGIAYDLNFSNPTAANIKSNAPLYLIAGEVFNSSDLTLRTYNSGNVIVDSHLFVTNPTVTGKSLAILNQTESQDIFSASASGVSKFTIESDGDATASGNVTMGGQLQIGRFSAAPTQVGTGAIYYNSTSNTVQFYNGSTWGGLGGSVSYTSGDGAGATSTGSGMEDGTGGIGLLQGCANNEILKWDDGGAVWTCSADNAAGVTYTSGDGAGGTSSGSGLEDGTGGIGLLQGCANNEVLKWNDAGATWGCATDSTSAGAGVSTIQEGDSTVDGAATTIDFLAADFTVTSSPAGEANISIDYANSGIIRNTDLTSGDGAGGTSSGSGLEAGTGGIGLLQGCADDQVLKWNEASSIWECGSDRGTVHVIKSADETVTNSAALQDDNHLTFSVASGESWYYIFDVTFTTNSVATNDIRLGVNSTAATSTCVYGTESISHAGNVAFGAIACDTAHVVATTATGTKHAIVSGSVTGMTGSGSVVLRWGQGTLDATNGTTVKAGSSVVAFKVSGADLAEAYVSKEPVSDGTLVSLDGSEVALVSESTKAYDPNVLGVVSTKPGLVIGDPTQTGSGFPVLVALSGRVPVRVSNENGPIAPGDFLTSSSTPGVAMKATKTGIVIGKALTGYAGEGEGKLMMFVDNQSQIIASKNINLSSFEALEKLSAGGYSEKTIEGEVVVDRLIAGLDVITNNLFSSEASISGTLRADRIEANSIVGLDLIANRINNLEALVASLNIVEFGENQEILYKRDTVFDSLVSFYKNVIFRGEVSFEKLPVFSSDTAGIAVIPAISRSVDVVFDKEYINEPIVNVTLRLKEATESGNIADDIKVAVTNVSTKGFTIVMDQYSPREIEFNWVAIAVSEVKKQYGKSLLPTPIETFEVEESSSSGEMVESTQSATMVNINELN